MCPIYEYCCGDCGEKKEEIVSLSDYDPTYQPPCPKCGAGMQREIAASPGMVWGYSAANGYGD